jgi:hypothetical protein
MWHDAELADDVSRVDLVDVDELDLDTWHVDGKLGGATWHRVLGV